jgi:predicted TIM-barrel fold metal-dependent hydrolase
VVCIDPDTVSDGELRKLHRLGARGVRLNLKTREQQLCQQDFQRLLFAYADRIRPLGWALQVFCALEQIDLIAPIIPKLRVHVVIDHLGAPHPDRGPGRTQAGYKAFIGLLKTGRVWTKLSGVYRYPNMPDLDKYVVEILNVAPHRVVWASDWPHSGGVHANPAGDRTAVQEYRKVDDQAWIERCIDWCMSSGLEMGEEIIQKVFRDNARVLWQYETS